MWLFFKRGRSMKAWQRLKAKSPCKKKGHKTIEDAIIHKKRIRKRNKNTQYSIYKCSRCKLYHIGTKI